MASHQYPINGTLTNPPSSHTGISPSAPPLSRHKSSNSGTDQWKISSANNGDRKATTTLPSARVDYIDSFSESPISISYSQSKQQLNNGTLSRRPQSPFSRLDRYKPKSPIINAERVSALTPKPSAITKSPVTEEDLIEETIDNTAIVGEEKGTTIEEKLARKQSRPLPKKDYVPWTWWSGFAFCLTYCIPNWALLMCGKKRTKVVQQAWREKITLCGLIILFCAGLGFLTFGMKYALCPHERITNNYAYNNPTTGNPTLTWRSEILIYGKLYPFDIIQSFLLNGYNISLTKDFEGANLSSLFDADTKGVCAHYEVTFNSAPTTCAIFNPYTSDPNSAIQHACIPINELNQYYTTDKYLEFSWYDLQLNLYQNQSITSVTADPHLLVLSDTVIDIRSYTLSNNKLFGENVDLLLRQTAGQDGTYIFSAWQDGKDAWPCIVARHSTGVISSDTMGCIIYEIVTDFSLAVVIMLMTVRYIMALIFHWWVSPLLTLPGGRSRGIFAWRSIAGGNQFPKQHRPSNTSSLDTFVTSSNTDTALVPHSIPSTMRSRAPNSIIVENDLRHTILFVTCYSEGEESIKNTLDSLVETTYSDKHKLLFIVADGIITGSGNNRPTSEICRDLLDLVDCEKDKEEPGCEYEAIADGYKRINQAQVYAGHYRSVPALLIIKCGNEVELSIPGNNKPGNRGKRDSQMILMTFFQRVVFYDTFSPLEYEIFWKMGRVMDGNNLTPDKFEFVLMVDADTKVDPDSITHMVSAMNNDITLMGLCGETKVANKSESWVTAIQVFEYFISHHYAKAFESMFGGVTCLPGCFSMYRIKAPKNGGWIPILASPDIIHEFNVTTVNTLHAKNLLLLGEDRFLSTLMLKVFPRRQMIFVPQAKCRTVVPGSFKVLLSQRRRWINSTVHNLMELALVSDLCGIACLSMQFVVVIDLFSSIVLPAAVLLLVFFFVNLGFTDTPKYQPLFILLATLSFPAILILLTAKKASYIGWMTIYLLAMPIWNLVLPVYSFWHFDDFTWGETRKVNSGDTKNTRSAVMIEEEEIRKILSSNDSFEVQRKLWHVWEKERLAACKVEKPKRSAPSILGQSAAVVDHLQNTENKSAMIISPLLQNPPLHFSSAFRNQHQIYHHNSGCVLHPYRSRNIPAHFIPQQVIQPSIFQQRSPNISISPQALYQQQQQQQFIDRHRLYIQQQQNNHRYFNNSSNSAFY